MGGLAFAVGGGFGPGFADADIHRGMHDAAFVHVGATEEHEFCFVEDALKGRGVVVCPPSARSDRSIL